MNLLETIRGIPGEIDHLWGHLRVWLADQLDPERRVPEHLDGLETAHAALALAGFAREAHGNYARTWNAAGPMMVEINPYHFIDISVALAGMVAAVADDADYEAFGRAVMHAEMDAHA